MRLVIYRIPHIDDITALVEFTLADGKLSQSGRVFTVDPTDSYSELTYTKVVLAEKLPEGSVDLATFTVYQEDDVTEAVVNEMTHADLEELMVELNSVYPEVDLQGTAAGILNLTSLNMRK